MESNSSKRKLSARETEERSLELRREGHTYRQIAAIIGCHDSTVYHAVKRALQRLNEEILEAAAEVRRLEIERLDYYLTRLAPGIYTGDTKAILAALRVAERRAKLLGLDVPEQEQKADMTPEQIKQLLEEKGLTV